jgi:hypothetical protein
MMALPLLLIPLTGFLVDGLARVGTGRGMMNLSRIDLPEGKLFSMMDSHYAT